MGFLFFILKSHIKILLPSVEDQDPEFFPDLDPGITVAGPGVFLRLKTDLQARSC
jgi:hypothetical protein